MYIDDITIFSPTLEQHYEGVNCVLERLDVANLKVNVNQCSFAKEEVVVLGFKVSKHRINPNPAKVHGINDFGPPKNVSGVKQILRMLNFYRKFIPDFATLAEPIVELTRGKMKKYSEVKWDQQHDKCLLLLKHKLSMAPILKYPDFMEKFAIKTDASQVGLGAVLTQEYEIEGEKIFMPVLCASRSLKGAERRYSVTDLEALAVVWAVKTFKSYVMGTRFKVVTDHNALKALVSKASLEGWLACWADFLMGFDFEIIYR